MRPFVIALSGKGGTGKTTISALLIKELIYRGIHPVLAVDADPNSNLHEALGVNVIESLGSMREEAFTKSIPHGMSRNEYINLRFRQVLVESIGFDLISMGRPPGAGCYCFANDLLTTSMRGLESEYKFIVVDTEAGMEHFARGTVRSPDILLIVTDPGARGLRTADRIRNIVIDFGLKSENILLIMNRVTDETRQFCFDKAWTCIPEDKELLRFDLENLPVADINELSPARQAVHNFTGRFLSEFQLLNSF